MWHTVKVILVQSGKRNIFIFCNALDLLLIKDKASYLNAKPLQSWAIGDVYIMTSYTDMKNDPHTFQPSLLSSVFSVIFSLRFFPLPLLSREPKRKLPLPS